MLTEFAICPNCQSNLGLEEIDFNQCDTCGCTWDEKGNLTGVVDTDDEDDDDLIGYDEDPDESFGDDIVDDEDDDLDDLANEFIW